jgi:Cu/Zn superoxide dismutase
MAISHPQGRMMSRFQTGAAVRVPHRRLAVYAVAAASAAGVAFTMPAVAHESGHGAADAGKVRGDSSIFQSPLSDLQPTTTQPLEGATGWLRMTLGKSRSSFVLKVAGIDRSARGTTYGAHLHSGPCVPGGGAAAGPHYNSTTPPVIDDRHEVWLDFTVTRKGEGHVETVVPFLPVHGARSVVIHAMPTDPATGAAGDRLACFPVVW